MHLFTIWHVLTSYSLMVSLFCHLPAPFLKMKRINKVLFSIFHHRKMKIMTFKENSYFRNRRFYSIYLPYELSDRTFFYSWFFKLQSSTHVFLPLLINNGILHNQWILKIKGSILVITKIQNNISFILTVIQTY